MNLNSRIYIAGHKGMVGSAILRLLVKKGYSNIITKSSKELDLTNQENVFSFFKEEKPEYVFLAAAKVGGIEANNIYRADFIYENIMIQSNVIHNSYIFGVKKLLFLGSSCIYPKLAPQPLKEEYLLSGLLESSNEPYAIAKIAGLKMCEAYNAQYGCNFLSIMPTNLYGPNDNYNLKTSHVIAALLRKFIEAKNNNEKIVQIWGSGTPFREFLYVDDLAEACLFLMLEYNSSEFINIGTGKEISINDLALLIKKIVNFNGRLVNDVSKLDGTPRKILDISKISNLGWFPKISLEEGLEKVYNEIKNNKFTN